MKLPSYDIDHYILDNGEEIHNEHPESFYLPRIEERQNLVPGDIVKLIFRMEEKENSDELSVERMWVVVEEKSEDYFVGIVDNDPAGDVYVACGDKVVFQAKHVIQIHCDD